jgi:hypothetical protein
LFGDGTGPRFACHPRPRPPNLLAMPDLRDPNLSDKDVIDGFVAGLTPEIRMLMGPVARELVARVTKRERMRCTRIVCQVRDGHAAGAKKLQEAGEDTAIPFAIARACNAIAMVVGIDPGSCPTCYGARVVPTGLKALDGSNLTKACPACAQAEAPSASVSEMSSASEPSATASAEYDPGPPPKG